MTIQPAPIIATDTIAIQFAEDLGDLLNTTGYYTISERIVMAATLAHLNEGKEAAMAVLVEAGVPMICQKTGGGGGVGGKVPTMTYSVKGIVFFQGS